MIKYLKDFFAWLFGTTPDSASIQEEDFGLEDASDLPEEYTETNLSPPEVATRDLGIPASGPIIVIEEDEDGGLASVHTPKFVWCLDNGHGSLQAGKRWPDPDNGTQLLEWKFNRAIVREIIRQIDDQELGIQYFNVVPEDAVGSFLKERVERANEYNHPLGLPKIYVSVHGNAAGSISASGIETWYHLNSTAGKKISSVFQKYLMVELGQDGTHNWKDRGIRTFSPASKNFYVLRTTSMPAVLTENGFYTNDDERARMNTVEIQQKIATAHLKAMLEIEQNGFDEVSTYHLNRQISL
ncbi:MAG: N-acetylmuramoyl-L-alanine amidase [Bacteroidota bacterium]